MPRVRVSLHAQIDELAHRGPFRPQFTTTLLSRALTKCRHQGHRRRHGSLQAYDRETESLYIQVQRGFQEPFLEFFNSVDPGHAVCGSALKSRGRVIVPDIANRPISSGTALLEVMLDAAIRAVQSTPLMEKSGDIWGMLSTYYRTVTQPGKKDLRLIDYFAGWAAEILEAEHRAAHPDCRSATLTATRRKPRRGVLPALED